ncbi:hypothetical protein EDE11_1192 [Methylomonas methanica]|jgi:hypothetical protein|uniref:Uncharacterized protein n=3 Tax=Methylococcaceae TaxID=403 RepID=A0A140E4Y3_9GAMM|nr:hypothetical protein [Methylomonas methanica]AMK75457.1 hypothetical protein JT25_002950 [Methylomonas denitrificans]OAI01908.1 hypothetical protein A1342_21700 [Methylomonas methanica]OAI08198.1 hypothetical protein A1353_06070 [Methylomonas methanica]TCV79986.1 hypothetical protein EDE11_1192 [Methylomonas methanica]
MQQSSMQVKNLMCEYVSILTQPRKGGQDRNSLESNIRVYQQLERIIEPLLFLINADNTDIALL